MAISSASAIDRSHFERLSLHPLHIDTPLPKGEGILNSATDLKASCPCGNTQTF